MIRQLNIENYALIESLDVTWHHGLTAITGETGSGKSIVLGALGLALGNRAETQHVRPHANKCIVEAEFDHVGPKAVQWLLDRDFDVSTSEMETIIRVRREVLPNGRSRAFIQDSPAKVADLAYLGSLLVDLHGQDETRALLDREVRLTLLDERGDLQPLRSKYQQLFSQWKFTLVSLSEAQKKKNAPQADLAYLRFQIQELEGLGLEQLNEAELEQKRDLLLHAAEVKQGLSEANEHLSGESHPDHPHAISAIRKAWNALKSVAPHLADGEEWVRRMESVYIEVNDIAAEAGRHAENIEEDPHQLAQLESVLDDLKRALFKHQCDDVPALILKHQSLLEELNQSERMDEHIAALEHQAQIDETACKEVGYELTQQRKMVADQLCTGVIQDCATLKMPDTQLSFDFSELPPGQWDLWGTHHVEMMFSANLGTQKAPLHLVASGGERSRLMLALKAAKSKTQLGGTIVLDEIDAGVSGDVASRMAQLMQMMAQNQQVITVTHLPQVAAQADHHVEIIKCTEANQTRTTLQVLSRNQRVSAIAGMLSGAEVTQAAMENAENLIQSAAVNSIN